MPLAARTVYPPFTQAAKREEFSWLQLKSFGRTGMPTHGRSLFELVDDGVMAYRDGNFMQSIQLLQQVLDEEPRNWRAKLYLAMSHYHAGETFTASSDGISITSATFRRSASGARRFPASWRIAVKSTGRSASGGPPASRRASMSSSSVM